jgi:polyisoprenyl-phosphate glycosyltransferase
MMKKITIICPLYNEEKSIVPFYNNLNTILNKLTNFHFEILFSNNCSEDNSLNILKDLMQKDKRIRVLTLSRNFGYQVSLLAAINQVNGDASIIIDVDNEDPPELIPEFLKYFEEGYKVIYGQRQKRDEFFLLSKLRKLFYRFTKLIADYRFYLDMAEFSLLSQEVIDSIKNNNSSYPFIRNEIAYAGFSVKPIPYKRNKRLIGKSNYNFFGMMRFAIAGILTASTFPLRINLWLSMLLLIINLTIGSLYYLDLLDFKLILFILILQFNLLFFSVSFISLYLSRVYKDLISRPRYIIDKDNSYNL